MARPLFLNSANADTNLYTSSNFTEVITPSVNLGSLDYEVACVKLEGWKSFYNISADLGNNQFRYSVNTGSAFVTVTIPDGNYSIPELDSYLKTEVYHPAGHYDTGGADVTPEGATYYIHLLPNFNTNRVRLRLDDAAYQVDLTVANGLTTFLGFSPAVLTSTATGTLVPQVSNGITTFLLHCDLVSAGYVDGNVGDVLMSFSTENVASQAKFVIEPFNPIYVQVNKQIIDKVSIRITDQNNNVIDLEGEPIVATLLVRPMSGQN